MSKSCTIIVCVCRYNSTSISLMHQSISSFLSEIFEDSNIILIIQSLSHAEYRLLPSPFTFIQLTIIENPSGINLRSIGSDLVMVTRYRQLFALVFVIFVLHLDAAHSVQSILTHRCDIRDQRHRFTLVICPPQIFLNVNIFMSFFSVAFAPIVLIFAVRAAEVG